MVLPTDAGVIENFAGGAKPAVAMGGRHLALGFWPVCVAPVLTAPDQKIGTLTHVAVFATDHACSHDVRCRQ